MNDDPVVQISVGPLCRFEDWPNPDVPNWRSGVYIACSEVDGSRSVEIESVTPPRYL